MVLVTLNLIQGREELLRECPANIARMGRLPVPASGGQAQLVGYGDRERREDHPAALLRRSWHHHKLVVRPVCGTELTQALK